ncbi:MAG: hypothetical protein ACP5R2_06340 [Anaerolineae bacterium]
MVQRKTQTPKYWQDLTIQSDDIEYLFKVLLDSTQPHTKEQLALALIQHRLEQEELAMQMELEGGMVYQPRGHYEIGDRLVFPRYNYAGGTVVGQRTGYHPRYGNFSVVQVDFGAPYGVREFAADFSYAHPLNIGDGRGVADVEEKVSAAELYAHHRGWILPKLVEALQVHPDFAHFQDIWLLKGLLAPINAGHLNIAEAAIDYNARPLPASVLLKDLDLPPTASPAVQEFSLNYALTADERFVNVGPRGQVLWYLRRMMPQALEQVPRHLQLPDLSFDLNQLDSDLRHLLVEIDDEATDYSVLPVPPAVSDEATLVLSWPHRRAGTLPITARTAPFFPQPDDEYVRITFVDRQSGERIPGWVVGKHNYVWGLADWYARHQLVTGAYITLHRTDSPLTLEISYRPVRPKREWVRSVVVQNGRLTFQNMRLQITCQYDELMIVGEDNPAAVDALWEDARSSKPLLPLLRQVALELIKINPQGTVHAKTLYSAVNVVRRCPPGPIFQELVRNECFVPMGHGYWTYDASKA